MTNEEWTNFRNANKARERMEMHSKIIENILRYRAYIAFRQLGMKSVEELLARNIERIMKRGVLDSVSLNKHRNGIRAEIAFYHSFRFRLGLCPTLDAGCSFDLVGKVSKDPEFSPLRFGGDFIKIDVTTSLYYKRKNKSQSSGGPDHWPRLFAHVHDNFIDWYDDQLKNRILRIPVSAEKTPSSDVFRMGETSRSVFVRHRRETLELVEHRQSLDAVLSTIHRLNVLTDEERHHLEVHARFFMLYKYALNLIPALSCGDLCDFVGEHNGDIVRYKILTDINRYYEREYPVIQQLADGAKYKVVVFDEHTGCFEFYDWYDGRLIEDPADYCEEDTP